mgnify:CR=1 FL=1
MRGAHADDDVRGPHERVGDVELIPLGRTVVRDPLVDILARG